MKDYTVIITLTIALQAKDEGQAEERAQTMEDATSIDLPKSARWYGGIQESTNSVEEA